MRGVTRQTNRPFTDPSRVNSEFAELIYADDQWLHEEFDALIAASFGVPPGRSGPPAPPHTPPTRRPWRYSSVFWRPTPDTDPGVGAGDLIRRQRSPPP